MLNELAIIRVLLVVCVATAAGIAGTFGYKRLAQDDALIVTGVSKEVGPAVGDLVITEAPTPIEQADEVAVGLTAEARTQINVTWERWYDGGITIANQRCLLGQINNMPVITSIRSDIDFEDCHGDGVLGGLLLLPPQNLDKEALNLMACGLRESVPDWQLAAVLCCADAMLMGVCTKPVITPLRESDEDGSHQE